MPVAGCSCGRACKVLFLPEPDIQQPRTLAPCPSTNPGRGCCCLGREPSGTSCIGSGGREARRRHFDVSEANNSRLAMRAEDWSRHVITLPAPLRPRLAPASFRCPVVGSKGDRCVTRSTHGRLQSCEADRDYSDLASWNGQLSPIFADPIGSSRTRATPSRRIRSWSAAVLDRSMIRPRPNGPRSLIRTTMDCPVSMAVTCTDVPNGRLRWAATRSCGDARSLEAPRYQDAKPI